MERVKHNKNIFKVFLNPETFASEFQENHSGHINQLVLKIFYTACYIFYFTVYNGMYAFMLVI